MRGRLAIVGIIGAIGLVSAGDADASVTRIVSSWNGHEIGSYYVQKPQKLGLVMGNDASAGYWLIRDAHWNHWGDSQATARGKLASASLNGTPVRIRARRSTYHSCLHSGDDVNFYSRAKIHIGGEHSWRGIPHSSLVPQCNNPRRR